MATPISEEELQLKKRARRRLIGAIALVTVVAVFLPMVLDHEPKSVNQDISIQIPAQNTGVYTSKIVQAAAGSKAEAPPTAAEPVVAAPEPPKAAVVAQPAAGSSAASPAAAKGGEAPAVKPAEAEGKTRPKPAPVVDTEASPLTPAVVEAKAPETKSKPKAAKSAAGDSAGYVVQIAALADPEKAKQLSKQIVAAGGKAYTEVVPTAKGDVTRVRAGPYPTRESAEKARDRLKAAGFNGNVVAK